MEAEERAPEEDERSDDDDRRAEPEDDRGADGCGDARADMTFAAA